MKKEYLQPIIEIEEYDDVVFCYYDTTPSGTDGPYVEDDFPDLG